MKSPAIAKGLTFLVCFAIALFFSVVGSGDPDDPEREQDAWDAFEWWYGQRAQPFDLIPQRAFQRAFEYSRTSVKTSRTFGLIQNEDSEWRSLGPNNVGGRVLSIAVNPESTNIVWVGSASGGLWRSSTGGIGLSAWTLVNTGFPSLCVSAIAIDPLSPDTIYIGTGEISLYHRPLVGTPGARSSYGLGILRSTDGGSNWTETGLLWTFPEITAVQRIAINPLNPTTLLAATSEGVYRSTDAGTSWTATLTEPMAMDVAFLPSDTTIALAACGNLNSTANPGMYRSTDAGNSWAEVFSGLPVSNFGRTSLATCDAVPGLIFAGIANASTSGIIGLYKSTNGGADWSVTSTTNYVGTQGWYDNIIAVRPDNGSIVYCGGLDIHKSTDGGATLTVKSTNVVHVDQHAIAFDPSDSDVMYFGCDGGIYKSTNGGESFLNLNNSFLTTQFYSGFANSASDSSVAIGGLQDNGTLKFLGSGSWMGIYDGDGGWCAIDPSNPLTMYYESQYLSIQKSTNGGASRTQATSGLPIGSSNANFIPPFVLAPSASNILYAGNRNVYKTTNSAASWFAPNGGAQLNGTKVACIGVSWSSPDTLMAGTGGSDIGVTHLFEIFASTNGGQSWTQVSDTSLLPDRYPTDIEFDPTNSARAYLTYSGYGTGHVFRTTDVGMTWSDISSNLPDLPHQCVAIDPVYPEHLYVGNDLGVYRSTDGGTTWMDHSSGMPQTMVLDLKVSPANNSLRAATFGSGVHERRLPRVPLIDLVSPSGGEIWVAGDAESIVWTESYVDFVALDYSIDSGVTWHPIVSGLAGSTHSYSWTIPDVQSMTAMIRISGTGSGTASDSSALVFTILRNPDVVEGWNLISLDGQPADPRKSILFPNASSNAFAYSNGYAERETLETGIGYWLKFPQAGFVGATGDPMESDTVAVQAGWNLVGGVSVPLAVDAILQEPPGIVISEYFGYREGYYSEDSLVPKRGYWVKANASGSLILPPPSSLRPVTVRMDRSSTLHRLQIEDRRGRRQDLFFTTEENAGSNLEMPPVPPSGAFDARFGSGRRIEIIDRSEAVSSILPLIINGDVPFSISLDGEDWDFDVILLSEGKEDLLREGERFWFSSADGVALKVRREYQDSAPRGNYHLSQNYPNPFNPVTRIRFEIPPGPSEVFVTIKVYSLQGEEIATLANDKFMPGIRETMWEAGNQPSGVYFIRMTTPEGSISRKIMHLR